MENRSLREVWEEVPKGETREIGSSRFTKPPKGNVLVESQIRWGPEGYLRDIDVAVYPHPDDEGAFREAMKGLKIAGPSERFPGSVGACMLSCITRKAHL